MADVAGANKKLKLLALYCGTEDSRLTPNKTLAGQLTAKGEHVRYTETPGAHLAHRLAQEPPGLRPAALPVTNHLGRQPGTALPAPKSRPPLLAAV